MGRIRRRILAEPWRKISAELRSGLWGSAPLRSGLLGSAPAAVVSDARPPSLRFGSAPAAVVFDARPPSLRPALSAGLARFLVARGRRRGWGGVSGASGSAGGRRFGAGEAGEVGGMLSPAEAAYRKIKETCSFRRCRRARPRQLLLQHAHECPPGCPVDIVQACRKPLLAGSRHAVEDHQDERARYAVESERSSAAPTNVPHSWKFRTDVQIPPRGPSARTDTPKLFRSIVCG